MIYYAPRAGNEDPGARCPSSSAARGQRAYCDQRPRDRGDLLPICGQLRVVLGIEPDRSDEDGDPAGDRGAVVFAAEPAVVAGVALAADGLVLPVRRGSASSCRAMDRRARTSASR